MPNGAIVQTAQLGNILREHRQRLRALELSDGSNRWIYVVTSTADFGYSEESPFFQNGWGNVDGQAPVSFKRFLNWVHIRGAFTGGPDNSVVFTLPSVYAPLYPQAIAGALIDGSGTFTTIVGTDGTVTYVTQGAF